MKNEFDITQENAIQIGGTPKRRRFMTKGKIIALSIAAVVVLVSVWDIFIDPPAFWQFGRHSDKQAILQYAKSQYNGNAKVTGSKFPIINPGLVAPPEESVMYFKYNDTDFAITAIDGQVIFDSYYVARAEAAIEEIIDAGFFQPRNIAVKYRCNFSEEPMVNLEDFNGRVRIVINFDDYDSQGKPQNIEWFYDFYRYWINSSKIKYFGIQINYYISDDQYYQLNFNENSQFKSSEEYYAEFQYVSYNDTERN